MRSVVLALLAVLVAGCVEPLGGLGKPREPTGPEAPVVLAFADRTTLAVEGSIELASAEAGPQLHRCSNAPGAVGRTLASVTPGRPFALIATDANADAQDVDIIFYRSVPTCLASQAASPPHASVHGGEVGTVPPDARAAIVWLYAGAHATFLYSEFPPLPPPTVAVALENTMTFRQVRPAAAVSTYHDMYEPHIAVAGTGTLYVTGHTMAADTHHSPVYASRDDGATWSLLPDPAPLPRETTRVPALGGRIGQGNEGGIAVDDTGRAWLYDAAYLAGSAPLYSWCDDGGRACGFEPLVFDHATHATTECAGWDAPRFLDKPWARYGGGKVLLANAALPTAGVDEFRAASALGLYDPATGSVEWNTCVGVGGMPGIPAIRDIDGHIAVPQVQRTPSGEGWMAVHHGRTLDAMATSPPIVPAHRSWQTCGTFNGYGDFAGSGTYYLASASNATVVAVSASADLEAFDTLTFDAGGLLRYLWLSGDPRGEGALLTWSAAAGCDPSAPTTFYAARVALGPEGLVLSDASLVAANVGGVCGHYMGNDVGPDGRAYLVVHSSTGACGGPVPTNVPFTNAPWRVFIQDGGPTMARLT